MNRFTAFFVALLLTTPVHANDLMEYQPTDMMDICLITGLPVGEVRYDTIRNVKVGKGSYGSVVDILPKFASHVQSQGANAVVNYVGSQRFGFWPWRIVRPVVRGEGVRLYMREDQSCKDIGGATIREVIRTNQEPHKVK